MKEKELLGKCTPWAWAIEPVRGCNLRCWHCATRLFPPGEYSYMSLETWISLWRVIREVSPKCRIEMANAGEPTLHPQLLEFVKMARKISPESQIQVTTNGTTLIKGKVTYKQLFSAGVNVVYTDMYASRKRHFELARESGYLWYDYNNHDPNIPNAWTYHDNPDIKIITLQDPPEYWPEKRKKLGRLGTFLNNLDWDAAKPFGLTPLLVPIKRRCTQPLRYVSIHSNGEYSICCQDFMGESWGKLGNVKDGVDGFLKFWFGKEMMDIRRKLDNKDRASISYCSRCQMTFSKCDFRLWPEGSFEKYWDGKRWNPMPEIINV